MSSQPRDSSASGSDDAVDGAPSDPPLRIGRADLFLTSFVLFGLQVVFLRAFKLFFAHLDAQTLLPWSFFGLFLGCFWPLLSPATARVRNLHRLLQGVGLVLFLYGLSCLWVIHTFSAVLTLVLVNAGLGGCLGTIVCEMEAYRFYVYDFMGGMAGALAAFFLPAFGSLESTYFVFIAATFLPGLWRQGGLRSLQGKVFWAAVAVALFLFLRPMADLTRYGALYQYPPDYQIAPERHGQWQWQHKKLKRIYSSWSSAGKVEVGEGPSSLPDKPTFTFFINNTDCFEISPDEARVPGDFGVGKKALVIGSGGGMEMRFLRDQGFRDITAVEINSDIYNLMNGRFAQASGHIFQDSHYIRGEGRNFVESHRGTFDVIILNYVGTANGVTGAEDDLSEDYLFTSDAFASYYQRLNPGGMLIIGLVYSQHIIPNPSLLRLTESGAALLRAQGENPANHIWLIGEKRERSALEDRKYRGLFILRRGPPHNDESSFIAMLKKGIEFSQASVIAAPVVVKNDRARVLSPQEIVARQALHESQIARLRAESGVDVSPASDRRPYFFLSHHFSNFPPTAYRTLFLTTCFFVFLILGGLWRRRPGLLRDREVLWLLGISSLTGLSYGLLEIALLNAFTIAFSSTLWSFCLMVFGLLLGSVLSGWTGHRLPFWLRTTLIGVAVVLLLLLFNFDLRVFIMAWPNEFTRSLLLILFALILSFLLSMLYPQLLKQGEGRDPWLPRFLLGANAVFFILGCLICRYMAPLYSLWHAFLLAGFIYFVATLAFVLNKKFRGH
jgi:hypothetical protein